MNASSLAMFRILFGCVMVVAMIRFLSKGWVKSLYLDPTFHFPWFSWIAPWPGHGMYFHVAALAVLAGGIAAGFCYRFCAVLFCLGFTYLELLDRTTYLNHYYLISLLSGLLICLPADRKWSVDAWRNPRWACATVPAWTVWLLRFQIGVVFVFSGLAKLNADWLFAAQPMRMWLTAKSDLPLVGAWLAEPWVAYAGSWFGAAYDLSIPFLLLLTRTRGAAYLAVLVFHLLTALLFPIGMFPWIMIAATAIFFPPDWPGRFLRGARASARFTVRLADNDSHTQPTLALKRPEVRAPGLSGACAILLALFCAAQILVPLRSWLYPQQGAWDVRGFNFAWRVMLVEKTGAVDFYEFDPATGIRARISAGRYVTARQRMMMAQDPFLIRQFAQFLGHELDVEKSGHQIRADAFATLNGHPSQRLVRPDCNLAESHLADWIVPLEPPNTTTPTGQPAAAVQLIAAQTAKVTP